MPRSTIRAVATIGIDMGKNALHMIGLDSRGAIVLREKVSRGRISSRLFAGVEDHFVPIEQVAQFEKALTAARSVTTKVYDRSSGGAEHCQLGAQTPWHIDFFDWMLAKFGDDKLARQ